MSVPYYVKLSKFVINLFNAFYINALCFWCMEVHPGVSSLNLVTATKSYATFYISDFLWSNS